MSYARKKQLEEADGQRLMVEHERMMVEHERLMVELERLEVQLQATQQLEAIQPVVLPSNSNGTKQLSEAC